MNAIGCLRIQGRYTVELVWARGVDFLDLAQRSTVVHRGLSRDHAARQALEKIGWRVLVVWEYEITATRLKPRLETFLSQRRKEIAMLRHPFDQRAAIEAALSIRDSLIGEG